MCEACPTNRDRAKAAGRELITDLLLPFILYGMVLAVLILGGAVTLS